MKRCPSCNNTFDDNLRFCQNDGTALLDEPAAGGLGEDDPLQIPDFDPNKTAVFSARDEMDVLATPPPPSFGDLGSLPSPEPESFSPPPPPDSHIPPPFGQPENQPIPSPSQPPPFAEPEQIYQPPPSPFDSPFSPPQGAGAAPDWNPPPAPVQQWNDQSSGFGSNTPFQPPGAVQGEKKGLGDRFAGVRYFELHMLYLDHNRPRRSGHGRYGAQQSLRRSDELRRQRNGHGRYHHRCHRRIGWHTRYHPAIDRRLCQRVLKTI